MKGHTPKMLPWLARKAGISEERAEILWAEAIRHATAETGWVGTSEYWRIAVERWIELIDAEAAIAAVSLPAMVRLQARIMLFPMVVWPSLSMIITGNWLDAYVRRRAVF